VRGDLENDNDLETEAAIISLGGYLQVFEFENEPHRSCKQSDDSGRNMKRKQDIDDILKQWPFDPQNVNVRLLELRQRQVLQMRVDMGILQMETDGRPDGHLFHGATTYYDFLVRKAAEKREFKLNEEQCFEIDREFVQFYHRRVCWLQLRQFRNAVRDAEHTLKLMDFCKQYSPDEQWTISHEQYRPFVLYHRTQAAALSFLNNEETEGDGDTSAEQVELAIEEVNQGLEQLKALFVHYEAEEQYEDDELVQRLTEFREEMRNKYSIGLTLKEQFVQAIANEDYELAASLKEQVERRRGKV
jgi:hypothetical protein